MPLRDITNVIRQPAADWVKPVSAGTPAASAGVVEQSQSAHQQRSDLSLPVIDFLKDSFAATMSVVTDDHTSVSDEATAVCTAPTSSEQNKRSTQKLLDAGERASLLCLALEQSNRNLEASHDVIRRLQAQIDQLTLSTHAMRDRAPKSDTKRVGAMDNSLCTEASSIAHAASPSRHALNESSISSPILSAPCSPQRSLSPGQDASASIMEATWQSERQSMIDAAAELENENARLRDQLAAMSTRAEQVGASHAAHLSALTSQLESSHAEVARLEQECRTHHQLRRKLADENQRLRGNIRVVARVRPMLERESAVYTPVLHTEQHTSMVSLSLGSHRAVQQFEFDASLGVSATQEQLFAEAEPLITSVLDGYNVCILAYGISGSGKTHSMEGSRQDPGLNRRSLDRLFTQMVSQAAEYEFDVRLNMVEIYVESVRDLLVNCRDSPLLVDEAADTQYTGVCEVQSLPASSTGAQVQLRGAVTLAVSTLAEVDRVMAAGYALRASGSTQTNDRSSRSHCIVTLTVRSTHRHTGTRLHAKLNLVDLAGSEDVSRSEVAGQQLRESQNINKSIAALSLVFQALSQKQQHIPYRNSRLTHLLSDSLGGNSKSLMLLCLAPTDVSQSESLNCLKFGQTVRSVRLTATANKEARPQRRPSIATHAIGKKA